MKAAILFQSKLFWFLLIAAIVATRHLGDLVVPQLRDEDGLVYFQQALVWGGWRMVLWPYGGYMNLLPRLLAALLRPIPLEWAPLAYNISGLVVVSAIAARVGTARIPRLAAAAGALALIVVPGSCVGSVDLDLLHFTLAALIAVNLLESAPESNCETVRRGIEMLIATLSGPEGIVLVPFALLRCWQWRRSRRGLLMLGGLLIGTLVQLLVFLGDPRKSAARQLATLPSVGVLSRYAKLLFGGWLGAPYDRRVAMAVFATALAGMAWVWIVRDQRHRWPAVLVLLGGLAFLCVGRAANGQWCHPFYFGCRHVYLPYAAVFWSLGWLAAGIEGWRRVAPALLATAAIASALPTWTSGMPPDLHWREQVTALREGRSPIFADARVLGWRCPLPVGHSAMLWVLAGGSDQQIHAFAICVPCVGPVTTEDPEVYIRKLQLP
jgi:hypothetical protein